jgi:hypothetical protein
MNADPQERFPTFLVPKAVQGHRTPGRFARFEGERRAARFWSAAVLCRFWLFRKDEFGSLWRGASL